MVKELLKGFKKWVRVTQMTYINVKIRT